MAAAMLALLVIDTAITGYLLCDRAALRRTVSELAQIVQELDHYVTGPADGSEVDNDA